jgi:hypothetical protein
VRRDGGAPFCLPQPCASTLSLACLSRRLGRNGAGRYCFQDTPCLARADNHRKSTAYLVAVAQLVERTTEDRKVTCSIQVSDTYFCFRGMSNACWTVCFLTRLSLTRFSRRRLAAMLSRQLPSSRRIFRSERSSHGHRDRLGRQALAAA